MDISINCPYIIPKNATALAWLAEKEIVAYKMPDGTEVLRIGEHHVSLTAEHHSPKHIIINLAHLGKRNQALAIRGLLALR